MPASDTSPAALALVILTYNEEANIVQALDSVVGWANEVFILDSHSTDQTLNIASRYGCHIAQNGFENYAKQRNYALERLPICSEWVLFLDADEWLPDALKQEISTLIATSPEENGFYINRRLIWMGRWIRRGYYPSSILRLFRHGTGRCEDRAVAEDPVLVRRVRRERLPLDHVWVVRYHAYQHAAQAAGARFEGPPDVAGAVAAAAEFVRTAEELGVENYQEGARGKDANDIIDAQEDVFRYSRMGTLVDIVDDAKASDGKAARMTGATNEWATQYVLDEDANFLASGPWHCYIVARVEPKAGAGDDAWKDRALLYGLYDVAAKTSPVQASKTLGEIGYNEYHVLDLGRQSLHPAMYFYVAPARNPGGEAVYVDRVLLIREKGAAPR